MAVYNIPKNVKTELISIFYNLKKNLLITYFNLYSYISSTQLFLCTLKLLILSSFVYLYGMATILNLMYSRFPN